jgi:hypothetical protein
MKRISFLFVICLVLAVGFSMSQGEKQIAAVEVRDPASATKAVAGPISTFSSKSRSENKFASETAAPLLRDIFAATEKANEGNPEPLKQFLTKLDEQPEAARRLITEGLATLPLTAAMDRAGLLDLVPRFAEGDQKWAVETLELELTQVPSLPRVRQADAKTPSERDAAISVTPDILRTHLASENLISLLKRDCAQLSAITEKILKSQKDEILRQNLIVRVSYECPASQLTAQHEGEL